MLKQLRYFQAVVECNSFTEAAEQCYISQSAISQQISSLEQELGVSLLKREKRKFSLTPAGEYLYQHSHHLLEQADAIRQEVIRIGQDSELRLRIGYLDSYEGKALPEAVFRFTSAYPEVLLSAAKYSHEDLYRRVSNDEIDFVFSYQRRAFQEKYENYHLLNAPCCVELSTHNKLAQQSYLRTEELLELPCILIAKQGQQELERIFYQDTLGIGRCFYFVENAADAKLAVIGNRGFLPGADMEPEPEVTGVKRLPLLRKDFTPITLNYCAFWKKERSSYYIEEFASILKNLLTKTE